MKKLIVRILIVLGICLALSINVYAGTYWGFSFGISSYNYGGCGYYANYVPVYPVYWTPTTVVTRCYTNYYTYPYYVRPYYHYTYAPHYYYGGAYHPRPPAYRYYRYPRKTVNNYYNCNNSTCNFQVNNSKRHK